MQQDSLRSDAEDSEVLKVFGYFAVIAAVAFLVAFIRAWFSYGRTPFPFLACLSVYSLVVGWGTVRLKKWAVAALVVPLCLAGLALAVMTIRRQPTLASSILAIGWAAILSSPSIIAGRSWRALR